MRRSVALEESEGQPPFYLGYAYEALGRAEELAGNDAAAKSHAERAHECLGQITDVEEKKLLQADLDDLAGK